MSYRLGDEDRISQNKITQSYEIPIAQLEQERAIHNSPLNQNKSSFFPIIASWLEKVLD